MKDYIVANFSGGKDSTAMVLRMIELGEHIDEVVCCDTTKEFPAMYSHIDMVRIAVEDAGIKFTLIRAEHDFDHYMFDYEVKRRKPELAHLTGNAWPLPMTRWCTTLLKKMPIDSYLKQLRQTHNVIQCIGIAADEAYRLERANNQNPNHRHPLVEWGWTEADCLKYCYDHGYDWNGLYKIFDRVSCWCCPLKSLDEYRKLWKYFPDLWEELKDMDRRAWNQFLKNYSVEDLEIRFQLEDEWKAQGLEPNPRTKAFREALQKSLREKRGRSMATDKSKYKPEGRRREGARFEVCQSCGLEWNVSKTAELPETGYICPRCRNKNRKAETNGKK